MDGIFVAYHNTARIFGFQYIPLEEMDKRLYGNSAMGPQVFEKCVKLLEIIMSEVTHHFPGKVSPPSHLCMPGSLNTASQNIASIFEARPQEGVLIVWAEPLDWEGPKEEKPVVELKVTLQNFVGTKRVLGEDVADQLSGEPCTSSGLLPNIYSAETFGTGSVKYSITQSGDDIATIRKRSTEALEKQCLSWSLPRGVNIKQMAELWEAMDFGGGDLEASKSMFPENRFRKAHPTILALRRVARLGREESESYEQMYAGEKKIVWGETDVENCDSTVTTTADNEARPAGLEGQPEEHPTLSSEKSKATSSEAASSSTQSPQTDPSPVNEATR